MPSVSVPVPVLVSVLLPVAIGSATVMLPVPPNVMLFVPLIELPDATLSVSKPLSAIILLSLSSVINPLYRAAVAELLVKAPAPPAPVPLSVKGSAVPSENPFRSRVAPEATIVPASVVPNGVFVAPPAAPSISVPSLIIVSPV